MEGDRCFAAEERSPVVAGTSEVRPKELTAINQRTLSDSNRLGTSSSEGNACTKRPVIPPPREPEEAVGEERAAPSVGERNRRSSYDDADDEHLEG